MDAIGRLDPALCLPLVIISDRGSPEEKRRLLARARERGVEVDTRERIPDGDLARLYAGATLTLYAPVLEPFGLVPLESMACGTPVVGVREGGVRETVVDGVTGRLTERDAGSFARAIAEILESPQTRRRMGAAGVEEVGRRWAWDASMRVLEGVLAATAARPRPG